MPVMGSYYEDDLEITRVELDPRPSKRSEARLSSDADGLDLDFIRAQLRVADDDDAAKAYNHTNVGIRKHASLRSHPISRNCSTPELAHGLRTPSDEDSTVYTSGDIHTSLRAGLKRALVTPNSKERRVSPKQSTSKKGYGDDYSVPSQLSLQTQTPTFPRSEHATSTATSIDQDIHSGVQSSRTTPDIEDIPIDEDLVYQVRPRSRSFSATPNTRASAKRHARRSSLPDVARGRNGVYSYFISQDPRRELQRPHNILPAIPNMKPGADTSDDSIDALATAAVDTPPDQEKTYKLSSGADDDRKLGLFERMRNSLNATYAPKVPPALILPSGPTDEEKLSYLSTNRVFLYSFGVLSFLSLSAGMWLFVVSAIPFYWFGLMVVLLQAYLFVSYAVSIVGKDWDYEKHKTVLEEHPLTVQTAPTVDIYLPCCKEPIEVLENTYKHVTQLIYPEGKLKVYVLDDGADDAVKTLAGQYGFNYICREDRPRLKKAGNLRWAFARTEGDFFNIYDADFCPRPDFLMEIIPEHMANPKAAIIQTPQFFRVLDNQTWVEQGAGAVQELFYRVIQVNRNRWGASICVGSNAVYRREALVEVGGTAEIGFSEDVHTGFYALTRGWEVKYIPLCLACGICPDTPRAFFSQQMRWCMGSTTLLTNPDFWRSPLSLMQKICYLSGMMYYSAISLSIFLNPLPGILMIWVRPEYVRFYNLVFAVPSLIYALIAIRFWAKASYGFNVQFIMAIQSYAYLTAIKDRLFGRALAWVPSGDTKAHKNNKYRNMRILAWAWMLAASGALIAGVTWRILGGLPWYDAFPILCLTAFNFFLAHRFMLCHGKL